MDESERRRERLKAMRDEAALGEASPADLAPQVSGFQSGLANPLTDASEVPRSAPRFDYYTDPIASFSPNRRGHVNSHVPRGFLPNPGHLRAPRTVRQMPPHYPEPWNQTVNTHPFSGPRAYQGDYGPFNGSLPYKTPIGSENPYLPHHELPPGVGNQPGGAVSYYPQPNFHGVGANFPNSGGHSGLHDISLGRGRDRSLQGPYSGRGKGNWDENKLRMGSDLSSNRNQGSANSISKSLYQKCMVDDPWKLLKPSIWHEEKTEISLPSSKTVGVKRPLEISGPSISSSQSLAEYLADSFNDAVKGDPDA